MGKKRKSRGPVYSPPAWRNPDLADRVVARPLNVSTGFGSDISESPFSGYISDYSLPYSSSIGASNYGSPYSSLFGFGSVENLKGSYTPYPTSLSPTSSSPASSSRPAQPELLETWEYHPPIGSPSYRRRGGGSNARSSQSLSSGSDQYRPESWTSSVDGRRVSEEPVNAGPSWTRMMEGGMVRRYQAGGIMDAMAPPVEMEAGFAEESIGGREMEAGFAEESVGGREEAVMIFSEAAEALRGEHPNPNDALKRFVDAFGIDALEKLKVTLQTGDGMSDSIPGNIDGVEDVALSEGEFIVPADAVSGIGNGSTDSGARRLMDMIENVRTARTGTPEQAPAIEPRQMGLGGLIRR